MAASKAFPTADVLGAITGRLMGDIGGIYEVLGWMTDGPVWTHQLPRIGKEAAPVVLAMHPHLAKAFEEADLIDRDNWREWLQTWLDRYGPEITVPRMTTDQHERIDPVSELAEKVHPSRIAVISTDGDA